MTQPILRLSACAAFLIVLGLVGCDSADLASTDSVAATSGAARPAEAPEDPRLRAAVHVQARHTPALMRRPGVVGTAARLNKAGEGVVVVYALSPEHARRAALPAHLEDVKVEVRITGLITALDTNTPRRKSDLPRTASR